MAVRTSPPAVVVDTQTFPRWRRATLIVITSIVVTTLAVGVAAVLVIGDSPQQAPAIERCDGLADLANRGLIPEKAVPRLCDPLLRHLVNLGHIPKQSLLHAPTPTHASTMTSMTTEEKMQVLVNQGLIPKQALPTGQERARLKRSMGRKPA